MYKKLARQRRGNGHKTMVLDNNTDRIEDWIQSSINKSASAFFGMMFCL
jgi:hypothetical protein